MDVDAEQESVIFISQMGEAGISPGFPYFMASSLTFVFPTRPAFFNALCIFLAGPCSLLCMINFIPIFMLVTIGQSASCRHCPTSPAEGHEGVMRNKLALLSQKSLTLNLPYLWSSVLCHTPCKEFLLIHHTHTHTHKHTTDCPLCTRNLKCF